MPAPAEREEPRSCGVCCWTYRSSGPAVPGDVHDCEIDGGTPMKASNMMVWALALLEFQQPVVFDGGPDFSALQASPPAELRMRFKTYRDSDPAQLLVEVPMDLLLRADDEAETIVLAIEAPLDARRAGIAETINRLGGCCATWYDTGRARLIIASRIRLDLHFRSSTDVQEAAAVQKQMTSNWLADVVAAAVRAAAAVAHSA